MPPARATSSTTVQTSPTAKSSNGPAPATLSGSTPTTSQNAKPQKPSSRRAFALSGYTDRKRVCPHVNNSPSSHTCSQTCSTDSNHLRPRPSTSEWTPEAAFPDPAIASANTSCNREPSSASRLGSRHYGLEELPEPQPLKNSGSVYVSDMTAGGRQLSKRCVQSRNGRFPPARE